MGLAVKKRSGANMICRPISQSNVATRLECAGKVKGKTVIYLLDSLRKKCPFLHQPLPLVTSVKEVMFSSLFVCLFDC